MPTPKPGEKEEDYIPRCVRVVMGEGATQQQALGKCYGMYREHQHKEAEAHAQLIHDTVLDQSKRLGIENPEHWATQAQKMVMAEHTQRVRKELIDATRRLVGKAAHKLAGKTEFQGLPISLEHKKGGVREGVDADGNEWSTKMLFPYGYIRGTKGVDGDAIDCYIGDDDGAGSAFVIHTYKPGTLEYDEDKVMLGFSSAVEARRWLEVHYDRYVVQSVDELTMDELKDLVAKKNPGRLEVSHEGE